MKTRIAVLAVALLGVLGVVACKNPSADKATNVGKSSCSPVDYKNGIVYFPCSQADFANALSAFREKHPTSTFSLTGDGNGPDGRDRGYFVIVNKRE